MVTFRRTLRGNRPAKSSEISTGVPLDGPKIEKPSKSKLWHDYTFWNCQHKRILEMKTKLKSVHLLKRYKHVHITNPKIWPPCTFSSLRDYYTPYPIVFSCPHHTAPVFVAIPSVTFSTMSTWNKYFWLASQP